MDINNVFIIGRIVRDAEKKVSSGGVTIVRFSLANGYRKKDGDKWKDETNYFDIVFIGSRAESISSYLTKGRQVAVDGELRQQRWEQDGEKRSKIEILANDIQLFSAPDKKAEKSDGRKGTESFEDDDDMPF